MAALARFGRNLQPKLINQRSLAITSAKLAAWNKDWKPGPHPKTPAEREAAAKKYGLRPEDYEPYPDDGTAYGDYPMLPRVAAEARPLYDDYDLPELKRNYGEPLHVDADPMSEDKWNPTTRARYSMNTMRLSFLVVVGFFAGAYVLFEPYHRYIPVMPKQLVGQGPHYTFEQK